MSLSRQTEAILLLTASLGKTETAKERPLSNTEWAKFAVWLRDHKLSPAQLLDDELDRKLGAWVDSKITIPRLQWLLGRSAALGLAIEKWDRSGLRVLTRSDSEYPDRLKKKLGFNAPPFLICCGNIELLNSGGVAVVGSRKASESDLVFTQQIGFAAAKYRQSIVSGGARGVDQTAMESTLESGGTCIGILADSLMRTSASSRFRKHLKEGRAVLATPFNPEAGFNVGNAMARNRYIYCLSDRAVVVDSTKHKGGTWAGAIENLEHNWVPTFVKPSDDPDAGNNALLSMGAIRASLSPEELFSSDADAIAEVKHIAKTHHPDFKLEISRFSTEFKTGTLDERQNTSEFGFEIFKAFMEQLLKITKTDGNTPEEIANDLELQPEQVNVWLEQATVQGLIYKQEEPLRYLINQPRTLSKNTN